MLGSRETKKKTSIIIKVNPNNPSGFDIQKAAEIINSGGTFIYPTDTIYGLGCSAFNEEAVKHIFYLKKRPSQKPMPVLVNGPKMLRELISEQISPDTQKLIKNFWPGALTLILPATHKISKLITGGNKNIGLRMPNCKLLLDLISYTQTPLIATSANISGDQTTKSIKKIIAEWGHKVDLIFDGGEVINPLASTVIDLTVHPPKILREGAIGAKKLQHYLTEIGGR